MSELRDKPAGTIRITTGEHAADTILWPALAKLLPKFPDIKVELNVELALTDIVTERYDAGVRFGEQVEKDMIAVRIAPDMRMVGRGLLPISRSGRCRSTPRTWSATIASTSACRPMAGSMPGSSRKTAAN